MFSILHITDLHRAENDPISNAELISGLISDRYQYMREDPPIAVPEAIVVSGDIIHGARIGQADFEWQLQKQYEIAYDFLSELADRFVNGNRANVIIVPGNHDIDWNRARSAMELVNENDMPGDLLGALHEPKSRYRWDWRSRELLFIKDEDTYRQRFAPYRRFFERFYEGASSLLRVEPWSDGNLYSLDRGRIGVAAFNSCVANDCFASQGEISRELIAQSHLDLQELGPWRLRVAVWHHDIEGPPNRSDYMDPDIVRGMIGRGYRLGLYGHQHRPQITPAHVYLPDRETMAVASAGSLCAGARDLPTGARRGYSIVEIGDDYDRARVHVREMAFANLFSRAHLPIFGGRSYVDLDWTTPADAAGRPEDAIRVGRAALLTEAEAALLKHSNPDEALRLLKTFDAGADIFGRRLMVRAVEAMGDPEQIIALVQQPRTIEELVLGVDARLRASRHNEADAFLAQNGPRLKLPEATRAELAGRIDLMQKMKS